MQKLLTKANQIKSEYNIEGYMTAVEHEIVRVEVNDFASSSSFPSFDFKTKSKYSHRGGSKSGNTELRIAGIILKMIRAAEGRTGQASKVRFTKADIARQVRNNDVPISERTVQRYLQTVLDSLQQAYKLHFEVIKGHKGGILIWTDTCHQTKISGQERLDEFLVDKVRRKCDKVRVLAWQRNRTKREATIRTAKAKKIYKAGLPFAMLKLASKSIKGIDIPHFNRFQPSRKVFHRLVAEELTAGSLQNVAVDAVLQAFRTTDIAMADFHILRKTAYVRGVLKRMETKRESWKKIKAKTSQFWQDSLAVNLSLLASAEEQNDEIMKELLPSMIETCRSKIA